MSVNQFAMKDLSKPILDKEGNIVGHERVTCTADDTTLPEGIDIEMPEGRLTPNPFTGKKYRRYNDMESTYGQDIVNINGLKEILNNVGEDISKTLVKTTTDGTQVIVPPCEYHAYPILLDKEIESARNLIKKPNLGRTVVYTILGWVLVAAFIGDILGLSGSDYFVAYAVVLGATVGNYLNMVWDNNKQTAALAEIRTTLLEEYMSSKV